MTWSLTVTSVVTAWLAGLKNLSSNNCEPSLFGESLGENHATSSARSQDEVARGGALGLVVTATMSQLPQIKLASILKWAG